ncbi:phosphoethanolamine transferase [Enterobacter sp. RHBSTW-00994]|uniref:phosphoethanolamine transferase n=1 Tax=Enterobacter sp. RHBSTW-00994 TaxID=2742676 RepID=UPI0020175042|nr:phosphoethanolamine transferase [Enterobacter sp. RHBSTW-00994]
MFNSLLNRLGHSFRMKHKSTDLKDTLMWLFPAIVVSIVIPICIGYKGFGSSILTFVTLYLSRKNRVTFYVSCLVLFFISLYIPVGINFGRISYGYVISALQTNTGELSEFLRGTSFAAWFLMFLAIASLYMFAKNGQDFGKKYSWLYLIAFVLINLNAYPKRMLFLTTEYVKQANAELKKLESYSQVPDDFTVVDNHQRYKNIIVVVGESVTRDYLSVYGYQHDTTPWLNHAPGYFYSNYVSSAPNTFMSLPRTLTVSDGIKTEENNNIVALAKKAGLYTHWISNQGFVGEFDTPSTIIAKNAQHEVFFKKGDYNANNTDDMDLLKQLSSIINNKEHDRNAVFLHMIGSHPDTCERLNGFPVNIRISHQEKFNCYLATLQKLDLFLERAVQILNQSGESYALVYFSDHGMTVDESDRPVRHGNDARQNYNVPFFIFTSDSDKHITSDKPISARQFISIFEWLSGFSSDKVTAHSPEQTTSGNITVFDGGKLTEYQGLKNNPIIH